MSNSIVEVNDVSMMFRLYRENVDSLKEFLIKKLKGQISYDEFWALKNISFQVGKGEAVGLVGKNGSGKSTLLKTIAGVLKPTKGSVTVRGTVAPMIELGAGFVSLEAQAHGQAAEKRLAQEQCAAGTTHGRFGFPAYGLPLRNCPGIRGDGRIHSSASA